MEGIKIGKLVDYEIDIRLITAKTLNKINKIEEEFEQNKKVYSDKPKKLSKIIDKRNKKIEKLNLNRDKKIKKLEAKMAKLKLGKKGLEIETPQGEQQEAPTQQPIPQQQESMVQEVQPEMQQQLGNEMVQEVPQQQPLQQAQAPFQEQVPQQQYQQPMHPELPQQQYQQPGMSQPQQQQVEEVEVIIVLINDKVLPIKTDTINVANVIDDIKGSITDNTPLELGSRIINPRHILYIE